MPAPISRDEVLAIAQLAELELSPAEVETLTRQLADILAYAMEVREVDTTGVPPTASVLTRQASDRPDEVGPCLDRENALAGAPDAAAGFFRVPRVIG
jgi:aspartyl-tRNA(Asn)/glutamyl-tRNA(Gln) amidotransferase subunit C